MIGTKTWKAREINLRQVTLIDAQYIAEKLGGKPSGNGWRCRCPVHGGDSGTSFSVRDGERGLLVHCFAGCSHGDIIQTLRQSGLWPDSTPEEKKLYENRRKQKQREHAELVKEIAKADQDAGRELSEEDRAAVEHADNIILNSCDTRDDNPIIRIVGGLLPQIVDEIEAALIGADVEFFNHGGRLVRPAIAKQDDKNIRRSENCVTLVTVDAHHMTERVTKVAKIFKFDQRTGQEREIDLPKRYSETLLARNGSWSFPILNGVISAPTINLKTGDCLTTAGFDQDTGLFLAPGSVPKGFVPPQREPSENDVSRALDVVDSALGSFPFVGRSDFSAAISGIITALLRAQIPSAPMLTITANSPGTGKSLLTDLIATVSTGRPASVLSLGRDQIEADKRLASILLAHDQFVSLDNIDRPLWSDFLCQVITQESVTVRPLGGSAVVRVRTNVMLSANGNNVGILGDLRRRVMLVRLDAEIERPEQRSFDRDAIQYVLENRGEIMAAALVLPLAYRAAGYPEVEAAPYGGFTEWDKWVRRPLIWAGLTDPLLGSESLRDNDPDLAATRQLYAAWFERFGTRKVTVAELVENGGPDLREAVDIVCSEHISTRRLAGWLRKHRGRIVDSLVVDTSGTDGHKKVALWRIQRRG